MGGSQTIQDSGKDTNDDREGKRNDADFRLVHAVSTVRKPLDEQIGAIAEARKGDQGCHDLTSVDITSRRLGPVVGRACNDMTVCGTNGDVDTKCETVEKQGPQDVGEEHETKGLLARVSKVETEMDLSSLQ